MKLPLSKKVLYLGLLVICAGLTAIATLPGKQQHAHEHADHQHDESHNSPENQKRMAAFHYNKGNKHMAEKQWEQAALQYDMALGHDAELQPALLNLSTALLGWGRYEEAFETLGRLEQLNPALPQLHYNLACYYSLTGETSASLEALKDAVHHGYKKIDDFNTDQDLAEVRALPAFKEWIKTI